MIHEAFVAKAKPIGEGPSPNGVIHIGGFHELPLDNDPQLFGKSQERFKTDAAAILMTLQKTLPGGTLDQLLIQLLTARAVHWVVPVSS